MATRQRKIYYKVVQNRPGDFELKSKVARYNAMVTYQEGVYIEAPAHLANMGYHLCVFRSLKQARLFIFDTPISSAIYAAHVQGVIKVLPPRLRVTYISQNTKISIRDGLDDLEPNWPIGTVMAKKVKLLERVSWVR